MPVMHETGDPPAEDQPTDESDEHPDQQEEDDGESSEPAPAARAD